MTLSKKILCIALLNVFLLAAALLIFAGSQFRIGSESLLLGPVRDRVLAIVSTLTIDLAGTSVSGREALLADYGRRYNAVFYLAGPQGERIAGPETPVPDEVIARLHREGPGERPPPPPPPRKRDPFKK